MSGKPSTIGPSWRNGWRSSFGPTSAGSIQCPAGSANSSLWFLVSDPLGEVVAPFVVDIGPSAGQRLPLSWLRTERCGGGCTAICCWSARPVPASPAVCGPDFGLVPAVQAGLVKLWGFDGKGGVELGLARWLFDRVAFGTGTDQVWEATFADLLRTQSRRCADVRTGCRAGSANTSRAPMSRFTS